MRNRPFAAFILSAFLIPLVSIGTAANSARTKSKGLISSPTAITVTTIGPTQADIDAAKARVSRDPLVQRYLSGTVNRLLAFEQVENGKNPPRRFKAYFYNYTDDRTIIAESDFEAKEGVVVYGSDLVPGISEEEIAAAKTIVASDATFGPKMRARRLDVYEAMPPVTMVGTERLVNVGIADLATGQNVIVGVSFKTSKVVRYEKDAPPTSRATPESCGIPSAGQGSTASGVAGQYQLTTSQGGQTLWEMTVIRPSSSSGSVSERSGIEIRDVKYKGKSVLKRGHTPVLNVRYTNDSCGPFRDWQYSEGYFSIPTTGVTFPNGANGGIAVLPEGGVATTVVETKNDSGNFQGVAIYQQDVGNGNELVLITEMNAGWYRYIMEWRFGNDGTIRPRYGFGSITNSCVCNERTHHVYWRLDFDIVQPLNKVMRVERARRFLRPLNTETMLFKSYQFNRSLLIQNSLGDEAYQVVPGTNDGSVASPTGTLLDTFGVGDFWVMKFSGTSLAPGEIDDSNPIGSHSAAISSWLNGESILNQDVVVWYAAHQTRIDDASLTEWSENILAGQHVVGPEIRPVRW